MTALWLWLALFGVWPLDHPAHDTWLDPATWLDLTLHVVGVVLFADAALDCLRERYGWD